MGWDTLFVQSGIHAADFANGEHRTILEKIIHQKKCRPPTYMMDLLK